MLRSRTPLLRHPTRAAPAPPGPPTAPTPREFIAHRDAGALSALPSTDGLRDRPQLRLRAEVEPDKLPSPKEVGVVGRWGGPHPGGPRTHAV